MTKKKTGTAKPSPEIVRKYLAELASALPHIVEHEKRLKESGRIFAPTISLPAAEFVLAALAEFEAGESLDHAFGLVRRGPPIKSGPEAKNYKMAKEIFWKRHAEHPPSWIDLAEVYDRGVRYLQKLVERYAPDIIAEAITAINSAE